jgi:hypothetical protein
LKIGCGFTKGKEIMRTLLVLLILAIYWLNGGLSGAGASSSASLSSAEAFFATDSAELKAFKELDLVCIELRVFRSDG